MNKEFFRNRFIAVSTTSPLKAFYVSAGLSVILYLFYISPDPGGTSERISIAGVAEKYSHDIIDAIGDIKVIRIGRASAIIQNNNTQGKSVDLLDTRERPDPVPGYYSGRKGYKDIVHSDAVETFPADIPEPFSLMLIGSCFIGISLNINKKVLRNRFMRYILSRKSRRL